MQNSYPSDRWHPISTTRLYVPKVRPTGNSTQVPEVLDHGPVGALGGLGDYAEPALPVNFQQPYNGIRRAKRVGVLHPRSDFDRIANRVVVDLLRTSGDNESAGLAVPSESTFPTPPYERLSSRLELAMPESENPLVAHIRLVRSRFACSGWASRMWRRRVINLKSSPDVIDPSIPNEMSAEWDQRVVAEGVSMAQPTYLGNRKIGELGEKIGREYGIYDDEGTANLDQLIDKVGARIVFQDDNLNDEASSVDEAGRLTIFLPRFTSARRDRFTIAHELGHYFLHYLYHEDVGPRQFARGARNTSETEANVFAASLLMPTEAFTMKHGQAEGNPWTLANDFGVSPAAAEVRAKVLGLDD